MQANTQPLLFTLSGVSNLSANNNLPESISQSQHDNDSLLNSEHEATESTLSLLLKSIDSSNFSYVMPLIEGKKVYILL